MIKPHDQLTIVRNRHRAAELRDFRELVETYFVRSERDANDVPLDWEGAQAARSRINQMLPRVIQIVRAAGLGSPTSTIGNTDPGVSLGRIEVLQHIFTARYDDGLDQEILDVIDMALGVYESGRYVALVRTFNPLHYLSTALGFVAQAPRRVWSALGLGRRRESQVQSSDIRRLEAMAARLGGAEELIESRLAAAHDRQAMRHAEYARQLAELAERLDFAERVLAGQRPLPKPLPAPAESDVPTPV